MKLARIKALCKAREHVDLFDREDGKQFLSDGCGIWPVDDKLVLNKETVRVIFEVSRKKWDGDWYFQHFRFGVDGDAELSGVPECLLDDFWEPAKEVDLMPIHERALVAGGELRLFATEGTKPLHLWASPAQFTACPTEVRRYALRTAPDGIRAIAVYDDMFLGGLVRVLNQGQQMEVQRKLADLAALEVM